MTKLDLVFLHDTDKGVLVEYGVEAIWLPRSKVRYPAGLKRGDEATFEVPEWLMKKKFGAS